MKITKILIIGFMGCGKSTIAPLLARSLDLCPLDSDALIKKKFSLSITKIFALYGEDFFRKEERKIANFLSKANYYVCAAGGGFANLRELKKIAFVIYLKSSFENLHINKNKNKNRPLNDKNVKALFEKRLKIYEKNANLIVDINDKNLKQILSFIKKEIK